MLAREKDKKTLWGRMFGEQDPAVSPRCLLAVFIGLSAAFSGGWLFAVLSLTQDGSLERVILLVGLLAGVIEGFGLGTWMAHDDFKSSTGISGGGRLSSARSAFLSFACTGLGISAISLGADFAIIGLMRLLGADSAVLGVCCHLVLLALGVAAALGIMAAAFDEDI